MSEPTLTEVKISYSVGVKRNLGNYESGDVYISEGETWTFAGTDMSPEDIDAFLEERYVELHKKLGGRVEQEYMELGGD